MFGLTAFVCSFSKKLHKNAVESTIRGRNGSQIARLRTPCVHQFSGARMEYANVRCVSRCGRGWSIRPHPCVAF
eukprot:6996928-Lingulodinium_polyedra.AAC.1